MKDKRIDEKLVLLRLPDELAARIDAAMEASPDPSLNSLDIKIQPSSGGSGNSTNKFEFCWNHEIYPAILVNMPTVIEAHKTFDNKAFYKSAEVGQMLIVSLTEQDQALCSRNIIKTEMGDVYDDGYSAPTREIVSRKFEKTRLLSMCSKAEVQEGLDSYDRLSALLATAPKDVIMHESQDIVDFEDWMANEVQPDGISFEIELDSFDWLAAKNEVSVQFLLNHPDLFMSREDLELEKQQSMSEESSMLTNTMASAGDGDAREGSSSMAGGTGGSSSHNASSSSNNKGGSYDTKGSYANANANAGDQEDEAGEDSDESDESDEDYFNTFATTRTNAGGSNEDLAGDGANMASSYEQGQGGNERDNIDDGMAIEQSDSFADVNDNSDGGGGGRVIHRGGGEGGAEDASGGYGFYSSADGDDDGDNGQEENNMEGNGMMDQEGSEGGGGNNGEDAEHEADDEDAAANGNKETETINWDEY